VKAIRWGYLALLGGLAACGSSTSPTDPTPVATNTITITASGTNPKNIQIAIGTRVLFINSDSRSHTMNSDPHPEHTDCPELNQVGFLNPGERRETGNLVTARNCGYHDHDNPGATTLQGTITIK
jgi:plastocyanin